MKILVSGSAGFIGFHLTLALLKEGHTVIGIDNINEYYDVNLKFRRLHECGIEKKEIFWFKETKSRKYKGYIFIRINLENKSELTGICLKHKPDVFLNMAAQAGVRYSVSNPDAYVQSNLVGFVNVLEACRYAKTKHLVYASSSSVYGLNAAVPFSEKHPANHPTSLYAATKKANELMAHAYSHLYNMPTTGLRFFTVYGPWGRPDMACYLFADAIFNDKPIPVYNNGQLKRDFTFVDDIVEATLKIIYTPASRNERWNPVQADPSSSSAPYRLYNIGNNNPVGLLDFIKTMEKATGKKAILDMKGMQAGDVMATWASIEDLAETFNCAPHTDLHTGLECFIKWYEEYNDMKIKSPALVQMG